MTLRLDWMLLGEKDMESLRGEMQSAARERLKKNERCIVEMIRQVEVETFWEVEMS